MRAMAAEGLTAVIRKLAEPLVGMDPRPVERITAMLYAMTRQAPGGLIQQAIAAIENALVDVKARALGVPVAELLCGPVRERLRSLVALRLVPAQPCRDHGHLAGPLARRRARAGRGGARAGVHRAQDQHLLLRPRRPYMHQPGFARNDGWPELNVDRRILRIISDQMAAFREGAGADVDLLLDLNFNFKTEGYLESPGRSSPIGSCGSRSIRSTRRRWP